MWRVTDGDGDGDAWPRLVSVGVTTSPGGWVVGGLRRRRRWRSSFDDVACTPVSPGGAGGGAGDVHGWGGGAGDGDVADGADWDHVLDGAGRIWVMAPRR